MKIHDGKGGEVEAEKGMTVRAFNPHETVDNCEFVIKNISDTHLCDEFGDWFPKSHFRFTLINQ